MTAPITGETLETGGSGTIGWLSSIRHQLAGILALFSTAAALADGAANFTTTSVARPTNCITVPVGTGCADCQDHSFSRDRYFGHCNSLDPTSGKKFRLMGGCFSVNSACSVLFEDNTHSTRRLPFPPAVAGQYSVYVRLGNGVLSTVANNVLKATASAGTF